MQPRVHPLTNPLSIRTTSQNIIRLVHCHVFSHRAFSLSLFQFEVVTTGWVSLALTFRGDLRGADIIVGWVDDGKATIVVSKSTV